MGVFEIECGPSLSERYAVRQGGCGSECGCAACQCRIEHYGSRQRSDYEDRRYNDSSCNSGRYVDRSCNNGRAVDARYYDWSANGGYGYRDARYDRYQDPRYYGHQDSRYHDYDRNYRYTHHGQYRGYDEYYGRYDSRYDSRYGRQYGGYGAYGYGGCNSGIGGGGDIGRQILRGMIASQLGYGGYYGYGGYGPHGGWNSYQTPGVAIGALIGRAIRNGHRHCR